MPTLNNNLVNQAISEISVTFLGKSTSVIFYEVSFKVNELYLPKISRLTVRAKLSQQTPFRPLSFNTNLVSRILNLGSENVQRSEQESLLIITEKNAKPVNKAKLILEIDINLTSDFVVEISALNMDGFLLSKEVSDLVSHTRIVSLASRPTKAPKVLRIGKQGKFSVIQQDPQASLLQVFEKTEQGLGEIATVSLAAKGEMLLETNSVKGRYCFLAKNNYGVSSDFNLVSTGSVEKQSKALVAYKFVAAGIQFDISDLGSEAIAVKLYKKAVHSEWVLSTITRATQNVVIFDGDVTSDNVYQYRIEVEFLAKTQILRQFTIRFKQVVDGTIAVTPTKTEIISTQGSRDVSITLKSEFVEVDEQRILSSLQARGISSFFEEDITKENLQSLLVHAISRLNLETGLFEDLGIATGNVISNNELGRSIGATELTSGRYQFQISSFLRKAETMLDPTSKKWLNPVTLRSGTLLAPLLTTHHSENQFLTGPIVALSYVQADLRMQNRQVENVRLISVGRNLFQVNWQTNGELANVFYYVVHHNNDIIARVLPLSNLEAVVKIDEKRLGEGITVTVTPVFLSEDIGTPTQSNTVRVD